MTTRFRPASEVGTHWVWGVVGFNLNRKVHRLPKYGECLEHGAWRAHRPWFLPQDAWTPYEITLDFWMQSYQIFEVSCCVRFSFACGLMSVI